MNNKQFNNMLRAWDEAFINARDPKEALTSFLNRLQRATQNHELNVKKAAPITHSSRVTTIKFIEKRTGTAFNIEVDRFYNKVDLIY